MLTFDDMKKKKGKSGFRLHFVFNVILGILVLILLNAAHYTGIGQMILNEVYDYLVRKDFKEAISESRKQGELPLSDRIRIVAFNKYNYDEKSPSKGYWTSRELLGKAILRTIEQGARVVVVDFAITKPAPVFCNNKGENENQIFLRLMRQAAEKADKEDAMILLAREKSQQAKADNAESDYDRDFKKLTEDYSDVIRWGSAGAFQDPSSYYQLRHFRFYEISEDKEDVFFSAQILAVVYLWHGREEGDRILDQAKKEILGGKKNITIEKKQEKPIYLYSQDSRQECISARYIFRLAQSKVTHDMFEDEGGEYDPLYQHPDFMLRPDLLLKKELDKKIYEGRVVIIGSTYTKLGDEHLTPLGKMPGLFLVANGINLFLKGLQIHENSCLNWVTGILTVIISALAFALLPRDIAFVLLALTLYIINTMAGLKFLSEHGILIDFWLPVIGILIDRIFAGIGVVFGKVRERTKFY